MLAPRDVWSGTERLEPGALPRVSEGECPACTWWNRGDAIYRDAEFVVLLATFAARPGHLWVAPRNHVTRHTELSRTAWLALQGVAHDALTALEAYARPARVYVAALGSVAPLERTFPHVHLHVVPIYDGGEGDRPSEVFTWKHGVVGYDEPAATRWREGLQAAWPASTCAPA